MDIVLGLDIGAKKTGIAKSDSMGVIIKPLKTVLSDKLIEEINGIKEEIDISTFVIGEPTNIEGGNQDAAKMVNSKIEELKKAFPGITIERINESFTSREAQGILKEKGIHINKENKSMVDMYAAAIILETFFDN